MPLSTSYRPAPLFPALGPAFYDVVTAARFPRHVLRFRNQRAAERVGLGDLDEAEWERHFAALAPLPDNLPEPLALRYHGHQFGVYNPALGDGRGFLLAQLRDDRGRLLDLGTKGSGQTPWSRGSDGKLTLKGGVREVLATEMLEALGVETSKSFSLFETGESLRRSDEPSPTRSSVLVRLSHSHVRFGTFQRLAYEKDARAMRALVDYVIASFFEELRDVASSDRPLALLRAVSARSAALCASWMMAGFVHGVLNTDNMNVTGESFDYGPYRFLPTYDTDFVAAYFDETGLYAYGRQPSVTLWNLTRLADALRTIAPAAAFGDVLRGFEGTFITEVRARFVARMGIASSGVDADARLLDAAFAFMEASGIGFERFFFDWYGGTTSAARAASSVAAEHNSGDAFDAFRGALEGYAARDAERLAHPYFARDTPATLLIDEIETIWNAIASRDDWSLFEGKIARIAEARAALVSP
jgi:uncharacterized protein YdiU (UPF0061 family)